MSVFDIEELGLFCFKVGGEQMDEDFGDGDDEGEEPEEDDNTEEEADDNWD